MSPCTFSDVEATREALREANYLCSDAIATAVFLGDKLHKPILCEGPPGVGKTELAKACARALGLELVRLQCYEGLDEARTLYEWKYGKQLLYTQLLGSKISEQIASAKSLAEAVALLGAEDDAFFSETFLAPRPLLKAMSSSKRVVLLIDEVDRTEEELEAFFLEVLGEYQVTVPELGTIRAIQPPMVFLTSNASRELSEALRRRCLHLAIDYPDRDLEDAILALHVPELDTRLRQQAVEFVDSLRKLPLRKAPSLSESIDWARALVLLGQDAFVEAGISPKAVEQTLSLLLKYAGDRDLALSAEDQG